MASSTRTLAMYVDTDNHTVVSVKRDPTGIVIITTKVEEQDATAITTVSFEPKEWEAFLGDLKNNG